MFNNGNMNGVDAFDPSMMAMAILMGNMNNMPNMNMGGNNMNNMNKIVNNMNMFGNNMNMGNMNNMNMLGNNMNMGNMNNMNMFGNNMNNMNINKTPGKVSLVFATTQGVITNMVFDYGTTMKNVFELYLKRVGRSDLIGHINNQIWFLYNANKMDINDNKTIENVIPVDGSRIIVNDVNNLIGA